VYLAYASFENEVGGVASALFWWVNGGLIVGNGGFLRVKIGVCRWGKGENGYKGRLRWGHKR
jgi:hypothetical protein